MQDVGQALDLHEYVSVLTIFAACFFSMNDSISSLLLAGQIWINRKVWACSKGAQTLPGRRCAGIRLLREPACVCVRNMKGGGRWSCIPNQLLSSSR